MEGDTSLGRDQCLLHNKTKEAFIPLESKLRSKKNFFNSSITINNKNFIDRLPNSVNTLGFDIVEMDLPNKNNELIPNGTTSITLRLKTKSDRFHLFFTAFKTELEDDYFRKKKKELAPQKSRINEELREVNTLETIKENNILNLVITGVINSEIRIIDYKYMRQSDYESYDSSVIDEKGKNKIRDDIHKQLIYEWAVQQNLENSETKSEFWIPYYSDKLDFEDSRLDITDSATSAFKQSQIRVVKINFKTLQENYVKLPDTL